jgi:carboxylesterase type B
VCTHLASPLSRGLFSSAVIESAYCGIVYIYNSVSEQIGEGCKQLHNCTTTDCLRQLPQHEAYSCMFQPLMEAGVPSIQLPNPNNGIILSNELPNIDVSTYMS